MVAVDVNVIAYYFISGEKTGLSEKVWKKDPEWVLPVFWRIEFLNVISKYCRFNGMTLDEGRKLYDDALEILSDKESHTEAENVLELSVKNNISVYDSEYVSLAKSLGIKLVTSDKELLEKFPETAISMENFAKSSALKFIQEKKTIGCKDSTERT